MTDTDLIHILPMTPYTKKKKKFKNPGLRVAFSCYVSLVSFHREPFIRQPFTAWTFAKIICHVLCEMSLSLVCLMFPHS